jgi:SAM-dependent methyltransferase
MYILKHLSPKQSRPAMRRKNDKHRLLTEQDMEGFALQPHTLAFINTELRRLGLSKSAAPILDFGCGRGRTVLRLRQLGYQAYGADIDSEQLAFAAPLFAKHGFDSRSLLIQINTQGQIPRPANHFPLIFSEQVLEHVPSLSPVAEELYRLLAPNGRSLHVFPSRFRPMETHLLMPFVHWIPKNRLRRAFIYLCTKLGVDPDWPVCDGLSASARSQIYYDYVCTQPHYRSARTIRDTFQEAGFHTAWAVTGCLCNTRVATQPLSAAVISTLSKHFFNVGLLLTKTL